MFVTDNMYESEFEWNRLCVTCKRLFTDEVIQFIVEGTAAEDPLDRELGPKLFSSYTQLIRWLMSIVTFAG